MKTKIIFLGAVLALMTASLSAQEPELLYATVVYSQEADRLETWVSEFKNTDIHNDNELEYFLFEETLYEEQIVLEKWMIKDFDTEASIPMEDWMTASEW